MNLRIWSKKGIAGGRVPFYPLSLLLSALMDFTSLLDCCGWIVMMCQIVFKRITVDTFEGLSFSVCFGTFLDLVWIFIFTFVYLMGVI